MFENFMKISTIIPANVKQGTLHSKLSFLSARVHNIHRKESQRSEQDRDYDESLSAVVGSVQQPGDAVFPEERTPEQNISGQPPESFDSEDKRSQARQNIALPSKHAQTLDFLQAMVDRTEADSACKKGAVEILCFKNENYRFLFDFVVFERKSS